MYHFSSRRVDGEKGVCSKIFAQDGGIILQVSTPVGRRSGMRRLHFHYYPRIQADVYERIFARTDMAATCLTPHV